MIATRIDHSPLVLMDRPKPNVAERHPMAAGKEPLEIPLGPSDPPGKDWSFFLPKHLFRPLFPRNPLFPVLRSGTGSFNGHQPKANS